MATQYNKKVRDQVKQYTLLCDSNPRKNTHTLAHVALSYFRGNG